MSGYVKKVAGTHESVIFKCPKCGSEKVTVVLTDTYYYYIKFCEDCGYRNKYYNSD